MTSRFVEHLSGISTTKRASTIKLDSERSSRARSTFKSEESQWQTATESSEQSESYIDPENNITADQVRARRLRKAAKIAQYLLRIMMTEIDHYGLLNDYIGFPYRSKAGDSAWDDAEHFGEGFCMAQNQQLFRESLELLWHDLKKRGFHVYGLSFREEKIKFVYQGRCQQMRRGIGLGWDLE